MSLLESTVSRRAFCSKTLALLGGLTAAVAAVPLVSFFVSPVTRKAATSWIPICEASQLSSNEPTKVTYTFLRKDGWAESEVRRTVFVRKLPDNQLAVLTNKCTHLGCAVDWSSSEGQFTCPCHGGIFDKDGNVVFGPPPKPLERLQAKVEDNTIYVEEATG